MTDVFSYAGVCLEDLCALVCEAGRDEGQTDRDASVFWVLPSVFVCFVLFCFLFGRRLLFRLHFKTRSLTPAVCRFTVSFQHTLGVDTQTFLYLLVLLL